MNREKMLAVGFTAASMLVLTAAPAFAYIDPGSGGMMMQLLLGGAAGVVVLARLYWRRFLNAVGLNKDPGQR